MKTVGIVLLFGFIVWIVYNAAPTPVKEMIDTFQGLPDHPSTQQMLEWRQKCQNAQASSETCNRLDMLVKAKIDACDARMGVRDLVTLAFESDQGAEQRLLYCDQRFPDMR